MNRKNVNLPSIWPTKQTYLPGDLPAIGSNVTWNQTTELCAPVARYHLQVPCATGGTLNDHCQKRVWFHSVNPRLFFFLSGIDLYLPGGTDRSQLRAVIFATLVLTYNPQKNRSAVENFEN